MTNTQNAVKPICRYCGGKSFSIEDNIKDINLAGLDVTMKCNSCGAVETKQDILTYTMYAAMLLNELIESGKVTPTGTYQEELEELVKAEIVERESEGGEVVDENYNNDPLKRVCASLVVESENNRFCSTLKNLADNGELSDEDIDEALKTNIIALSCIPLEHITNERLTRILKKHELDEINEAFWTRWREESPERIDGKIIVDIIKKHPELVENMPIELLTIDVANIMIESGMENEEVLPSDTKEFILNNKELIKKLPKEYITISAITIAVRENNLNAEEYTEFEKGKEICRVFIMENEEDHLRFVPKEFIDADVCIDILEETPNFIYSAKYFPKEILTPQNLIELSHDVEEYIFIGAFYSPYEMSDDMLREIFKYVGSGDAKYLFEEIGEEMPEKWVHILEKN